MAAFPAGYTLDRASPFSNDKITDTWVLTDGTSLQQIRGADAYVTIRASIKYMDSADRTTLKTFLDANRYSTATTWTIDGINYSGIFVGGYKEKLIGQLYSISFIFRAKEV